MNNGTTNFTIVVGLINKLAPGSLEFPDVVVGLQYFQHDGRAVAENEVRKMSRPRPPRLTMRRIPMWSGVVFFGWGRKESPNEKTTTKRPRAGAPWKKNSYGECASRASCVLDLEVQKPRKHHDDCADSEACVNIAGLRDSFFHQRHGKGIKLPQ